MLSDAQWTVLEPLVEACRPKAKTPPQDLRRTLSAILWRHQNGAKWRAIPQDLGPWWRAAQIFIRWSRAGVWERLLALVQERGVRLGMVFLLGQPYGYPSVLSGYSFDRGSQAGRDAGPPGGTADVTPPVACAASLEAATGAGQWTCEHRDPVIRRMVAFRRAVAMPAASSAFSVICFCRDMLV